MAGYGTVAIIAGVLLPSFGVSELAFMDGPSSLIWISFSFYAIVKHRLLDIRFVVTRSLVYGSLLTLVTLSFVFITFLSAQFFGDTNSGRAVVSFVVAALIVFGLDPLKRLLSTATDKVFFKAKIDYQAVLRKLTETLNFQLDLNVIIGQLRQTLISELKLKSAATLLRVADNGKTERFQDLPDLFEKNPQLILENRTGLVQYLREKKHAAILESLERKIDDAPEDERPALVASKEEFERMGMALAAPIFAQGHLIAILVLGPKLSGDSFSNEDLNLIEVLSPQIGSAIQKAQLFEEVRQFGESLKVKVAEATEELQERNVSLQTLQHITTNITRTLDFSQAVQNIADSVATDLGYIGAVLIFLDDDGRTVRARAITQTPLTKKALKLLPIDFTQYTTDINDPASTALGHEVIRTGEMRMTESFPDVIHPPLPKPLAAAIQKVLGMKSMVLIPIVAEGRAIGVIEIGLKKPLKDISKQEIATMQSMADELGIVSRNLKLFDQLRKANADLEIANQHLKQLDQAKSEFVSIASHQLRTPMTGIMGYLSMMVGGDFGRIDPKHLTILRTLLDESQRMIRLINLFLNVSKIEAGKFSITKKEVQILDVIEREVQELTKIASDKGLKLVFERPKQPFAAMFLDPDKLQDVLLNLIDNAIKYTAKGSIRITAEQDATGVTVHIKDTGIGISKQNIRELFNKFVRAQGIAQIHPDGSGLGLFIAKSVVEGHGGKIWVESEGEGRGSTFSFWLPFGGEAGTTTLKGALS